MAGLVPFSSFPDFLLIVMAGLVPAIHVCVYAPHDVDARDEPGHDAIVATCAMAGWVYIMTNRPNGVLYVGVTSDLARRSHEHREGLVDGFTKRYGLKRLVYAEQHEEITTAIQREKSLKHWPRAWKVRLITASNPDWDDISNTVV